MAARASILVIDDDDRICRVIARTLERHGFHTAIAHDGNEGWRIVNEGGVDIVVTDIFMPDKDGLELICQIVESFPDTKIIAISAGGKVAHRDYLPDAMRLGASAVFYKPIDLEGLLEAVVGLTGRAADVQ